MEHAISRLPAGLRLPVRSAQLGLFAGAFSCAWFAVGRWLQAPAAGLHPSPAVFLWTTLGVGWMTLTHGLLRPLADRSPRLAGQLWSAALTFPAALAIGTRGNNFWLYDLSLWVMAAIFSGFIGLVLGNALDRDSHFFRAES